MSYITNTDIENFLGTLVYVQLTDDTGTGSADTTKVSQARLGAEGEVNSYLATRYQVPVNITGESETGEVIKTFALSLAALACAAVFLRRAGDVRNIDRGFRDPEHVLLIQTSMEFAGVHDVHGWEQSIESIVDRLCGDEPPMAHVVEQSVLAK